MLIEVCDATPKIDWNL